MISCRITTDTTITAKAASGDLGLDAWLSAEVRKWLCSVLHASPARMVITNGNEVAAFDFLIRKLPLGLRLGSVYPYGEILGTSDLIWGNLSDVRNALLKQRIVRLEIPFTGHQIPDMPAQASALVLNQLDAIRQVVHLKPGGNIESTLHPNVRWAIRKASRSGITVRAAGLGDAEVMQDLYARTMRAKSAPINYGSERWSGLVEQLVPRNLAIARIAEIDGHPVGMAAGVIGEDSFHLVQLAVPPEFQSSRAGEMLVLDLMNMNSARGARYFDFMASPASDTGLIAYKSKWGGAAQAIHHVGIVPIRGFDKVIDLGRAYIRRKARA